jgi:death-on-curing protein
VDRVWLGEAVVLALHGRLIAEHGGAQDIRDSSLLDSALARPRQLLAYVFLGSNGFRLVASEVEAAQFVMLLASSEIEEPEFGAWLRANCDAVDR